MKDFVDYVDSGRPIIGIRTATHAFEIEPGRTYHRYSWDSHVEGWDGGFGRKVLGETWIAHHAQHGKQSTRALIVAGQEQSPILRGIRSGEIWVPTDVYQIRLPQSATCIPLLVGQVLSGMQPDDPAVTGRPNDPMIPIAWTSHRRKPSQSSTGLCHDYGIGGGFRKCRFPETSRERIILGDRDGGTNFGNSRCKPCGPLSPQIISGY